MKDREQFEALLQEILEHSQVRRMQTFVHHGRVSTYDHCLRVAALSYRLNRALHLGANEKVLVTGAMLHDFFLYDWHKTTGYVHRWHNFLHAEWARQNAVKYFHVNELVQHVIRTHMWPLNLTKIPKTREAWIVTLADKHCAVIEGLFMWK